MDENAKEDHDGKAAPYGSGFEKVNENFKISGRAYAIHIVAAAWTPPVSRNKSIINPIKKEMKMKFILLLPIGYRIINNT